MAECAGDEWISAKFQPSNTYVFPKRTFGSKREKCSFRAKKYNWLNHDRVAGTAFCHMSLTAEYEKLLVSTKNDFAFVSRATGRMRPKHSAHTWPAVATEKHLQDNSFQSKLVTLVKGSAQSTSIRRMKTKQCSGEFFRTGVSLLNKNYH